MAASAEATKVARAAVLERWPAIVEGFAPKERLIELVANLLDEHTASIRADRDAALKHVESAKTLAVAYGAGTSEKAFADFLAKPRK